MTYIEFFSKTVAENLCAPLIDPPERVILIGDKRKELELHAERYRRLFAARGQTVCFETRSVNRNRLDSVMEALTDIVMTYGDCAFDLTGGDELYLVGLGIVCERFRDRHLQLHRFNIRTGSLLDCDRDGHTIGEDRRPTMTVEEYVLAGGGRIVYEDEKPMATIRWDMSYGFERDLKTLWEICRPNVRLYNTQISVLEAAERCRTEGSDALTTVARVEALEEELAKREAHYLVDRDLLDRLRDAGLLTAYYVDGGVFRVSYKDEQVKRVLTKAGLVLELKLYLVARAMTDKDGTPFFSDVRHGVFLDWDGEESAYESENEVDLVLMRGVVPLFVSCKNGFLSSDECYKLSTVTEKFGGKYAKKMLAASALHLETPFGRHIAQRCQDMGVWLLSDLPSMTDEEIAAAIRGFFSL